MVGSVYPIATSGQLVRDSTVEGLWIGDDQEDTIQISARADSTYLLHDSQSDELSVLRFTRIEGALYVETFPQAFPHRELSFFIGIHAFVRVERPQGAILIRHLNPDWTEEYARSHPGRIHLLTVDDLVLVTDSTPALRAFLGRFGSDRRAMRDSAILHRIGPARDGR
jgi:hypothetical protein